MADVYLSKTLRAPLNLPDDLKGGDNIMVREAVSSHAEFWHHAWYSVYQQDCESFFLHTRPRLHLQQRQESCSNLFSDLVDTEENIPDKSDFENK